MPFTLSSNVPPVQKHYKRTVIASVLAGSIVFSLFGGAFIFWLIGTLLATGGLAYVIAVIWITFCKRIIEKSKLRKANTSERQEYSHHPAVYFQTASQNNSWALNAFFTIGAILYLIAGFLYIQSSIVILNNASLLSELSTYRMVLWTIIIFGNAPLITAALWLAVLANVPLIYNTELRIAERLALKTKTGAWKKILTNRIWSWSIWIFGGVVACAYLYYSGHMSEIPTVPTGEY